MVKTLLLLQEPQVQSLVREVTLLHGAAKKSPSLPSDQRLCRTSQARVASPSQVRSAHGHRPDLTVPSCPCACLSHSPHTPQPWSLWTPASPGHCPHLTVATILVQPHDVQKCPCGRDQIWWAALPGSGQAWGRGVSSDPPNSPSSRNTDLRSTELKVIITDKDSITQMQCGLFVDSNQLCCSKKKKKVLSQLGKYKH